MLKLPAYTGPMKETCKPLQIHLTEGGQQMLLQIRQHLGGAGISATLEAVMHHAVTSLKIPAALT